MDVTRLTAWRTAAASALASRILSRPDSARLLMVGAGALAPFPTGARLGAPDPRDRDLEPIAVPAEALVNTGAIWHDRDASPQILPVRFQRRYHFHRNAVRPAADPWRLAEARNSSRLRRCIQAHHARDR